MILCREPTLADASELARVGIAAWQAGFQGLLPRAFLDGLDVDRARARWVLDLGAERAGPPHFLVAESQSVVVGFSIFGPSRDEAAPPSEAELFALHVLPAAWRTGVGSALLHQSLNRMRARPFAAASLWVIEGNARARQFYERLGWKADGATRVNTRFGDAAFPEVRYRIDLV